jgi:hypothetical protein
MEEVEDDRSPARKKVEQGIAAFKRGMVSAGYVQLALDAYAAESVRLAVEAERVYRWINFNAKDWATQEHPPERKLVLVQRAERQDIGSPIKDAPAVAVGYLRYAAGDKSSPFFVCPGVGGETVAWCDCLPEGFGAPLWPGFPVKP